MNDKDAHSIKRGDDLLDSNGEIFTVDRVEKAVEGIYVGQLLVITEDEPLRPIPVASIVANSGGDTKWKVEAKTAQGA